MLRCLEVLNRNFPATQFWDVGLCVSLHDTFFPRGKPLRIRLIMVTNALRVRPHCGATNIQLCRDQNRQLYCNAERFALWLHPLPPIFECTGCLSGDSLILHFLTHVKQTRSRL